MQVIVLYRLIIMVIFPLYTSSDCKADPNVVIMDATSLAFRKDLLTWQAFLKAPSSEVNRRAGR